jgi:hypothetical protein
VSEGRAEKQGLAARGTCVYIDGDNDDTGSEITTIKTSRMIMSQRYPSKK